MSDQTVSDSKLKFFAPVQAPHQPLFEVTDVNVVALWGWNSNTEDCTICHESLLSICVNCSNRASDGKCSVTWGECNHGYHSHCISKWTSTHSTCPLCQQPWKQQPVRGE